MRFQTNPHLAPASTPKVISILLAIIAGASVACTVLNSLFFGSPGLDGLFGLSWAAIHKSFYWQPFTYFFISESLGMGLTGSYVLGLCFNLYVLWVLSTIAIEYLGKMGFLLFFLLCGLLSGLAALGGMALTGYYPLLTGQTPVILGLLTLWTLLNPEAMLFLFYMLPIKVKWVTVGVLGVLVLNSLTHLDLVSLLFYLAAPLFAYFFWLFFRHSPLNALRLFKEHMMGIFRSSGQNSKIIDIRTGRPKKH